MQYCDTPRMITVFYISLYVLSFVARPGWAAGSEGSCVMNDNFCDCGHDESETAACSFYTLERFSCKSTVFVNQTIPLSRVDDGVCDCCDGSDEKLYCKNTCQEMESKRVEIAEKESFRRNAGASQRAKLVQEAQEKMEAKLADGATSKARLTELEGKIQIAKDTLSAATKAEYEETQSAIQEMNVVTGDYKSRFAHILTTDLMINALVLGTLNGNQSTVEALILAAEKAVPPDSTISSDHVLESFQQFKTLRESCVSPETSGASTDDFLQVISSIQNHLSLKTISSEELSAISFNIFDKLRFECESGAIFSPSDSLKSAINAACEIMSHYYSKQEATMQDSNDAKEAVQAARNDLTQLESDLRIAKAQHADYDDILRKDFGPDNILFWFYKKCFELSQDKYYYSICPFGIAKQDSTTLGKFESWEMVQDQIVFKFLNGQQCFATRAPRDMTLTLSCGSETKLIEISEPETCSYAAVMETPTVC